MEEILKERMVEIEESPAYNYPEYRLSDWRPDVQCKLSKSDMGTFAWEGAD